VIPIMFALISANIVNLVGDWALILRTSRVPAMGITGSGWATCVALIYMAGVSGRHFALGGVETLATQVDRRGFALISGGLPALLKLGTLPQPQIFLEIGAFSAATALIARLGPVLSPVTRSPLNCAALSFMVPLASAPPPRSGWDNIEEEKTLPAPVRARDGPPFVLGAGFIDVFAAWCSVDSMWISRLFSS